jgi:metal-dependent amidase/aminoacylase/carboxypeptidase family protein
MDPIVADLEAVMTALPAARLACFERRMKFSGRPARGARPQPCAQPVSTAVAVAGCLQGAASTSSL